MSTLADPRAATADGSAVEMTYRDAINAALHDEMEADARVVLLGEDVDASGGVFKTNEGLPERFPGRRLFLWGGFYRRKREENHKNRRLALIGNSGEAYDTGHPSQRLRQKTVTITRAIVPIMLSARRKP